MVKLKIIWLSLMICSMAQATWSNRPQVGVGYTNNANLTTDAPQSDFFWWVRESLSLLGPQETWNLWLNYRVYSKTTENDVLTYRFANTQTRKAERFGEYEWEWALGGQQYTRGNPANSEENFDNFFLETFVTKNYVLRPKLEASLEPGYLLKYFPHLAGRWDQSIHLLGSLDWRIQEGQRLLPYAEIGLVFSNQALYNRNSLEVGALWSYLLRPERKIQVKVLSRASAFPNRKVSETVLIFRGRGNGQVVTVDENETQSLFQIQGAYIREMGSAELKAAVQLTNQATRSGLDDYSELQWLLSCLFPF